MGRSMVVRLRLWLWQRQRNSMDLHLSGACVVKLCSHAFLAQGLHMDCFYLKQGLTHYLITTMQCYIIAALLVSSRRHLVGQIRQYTHEPISSTHLAIRLEISVRLCYYAATTFPRFLPYLTKVRYTDGWCFLLWFVVNRWRLVSLISIRFISLHTYV